MKKPVKFCNQHCENEISKELLSVHFNIERRINSIESTLAFVSLSALFTSLASLAL